MIARWGRAARWLGAAPVEVLDAGCAFGYGTRLLARRHRVVGLERSRGYVRRAAADLPDARFVLGDVTALPFRAASFDAVVLLDVLEHVDDDHAALREVARVLRPGGRLVLSVPNRGLLWRLDSLNLYRRLRRRAGWPSAVDEGANTSPWHRHYSLRLLLRLLGPGWELERLETTALGLAELVHLAVLAAALGLMRSSRLYRALRYLYYGAYVVEDLVPLPGGYHLTLAVRRGPTGKADQNQPVACWPV